MLEIINQRYMEFLFEIAKKPRNISELSKRMDLTLSVASTLLSRWNREGVLIKEKSDGERGREIIITLTEYGKKQVKLLSQLKSNHIENKKSMIEEQNKIQDIANNKNQNSEKEVKNAGKN